MALLEAQPLACPWWRGLWVGVPSIADGITGPLTPPGEAGAFAVWAARALIVAPASCRYGGGGRDNVRRRHADIAAAAAISTGLWSKPAPRALPWRCSLAAPWPHELDGGAPPGRADLPLARGRRPSPAGAGPEIAGSPG